MRQRGGAGGGPKLPRGSLGLGGLVFVGGLAVFAINASIFNGTIPFLTNLVWKVLFLGLLDRESVLFYCRFLNVCFLSRSLIVVDGGHRAIKYKRISGVSRYIYQEGTHFNIPWFETPIIYDVRAKPRNIASLTGTKGKISPNPFSHPSPLTSSSKLFSFISPSLSSSVFLESNSVHR